MRVLMMVLALASATPLAARELAVPADKGWQHQETGLILTSRLAGLQRVPVHSSNPRMLVMGQVGEAGGGGKHCE